MLHLQLGGGQNRQELNTVAPLLANEKAACAFPFILLKIIKQCCILMLIHVGELQFSTQ